MFNSYVAEDGSLHLFLGRGHPEEDRHVQEDRPHYYEVIEVGASQSHNPAMEGGIQSAHSFWILECNFNGWHTYCFFNFCCVRTT